MHNYYVHNTWRADIFSPNSHQRKQMIMILLKYVFWILEEWSYIACNSRYQYYLYTFLMQWSILNYLRWPLDEKGNVLQNWILSKNSVMIKKNTMLWHIMLLYKVKSLCRNHRHLIKIKENLLKANTLVYIVIFFHLSLQFFHLAQRILMLLSVFM